MVLLVPSGYWMTLICACARGGAGARQRHRHRRRTLVKRCVFASPTDMPSSYQEDGRNCGINSLRGLRHEQALDLEVGEDDDGGSLQRLVIGSLESVAFDRRVQ